MKEIMEQYGQSVIAAVVAVLLLVIIGGSSVSKTQSIYAKTGQIIQSQSSVECDSAEFERYWRLR